MPLCKGIFLDIKFDNMHIRQAQYDKTCIKNITGYGIHGGGLYYLVISYIITHIIHLLVHKGAL